jgi:hypothetical protein
VGRRRISIAFLFIRQEAPFRAEAWLVAQSLSEPVTLLTVDPKLERYGSTVRIV